MPLRPTSAVASAAMGPLSVRVQDADEMKRPNADDITSRVEEAAKVGRPFRVGNRAGAGRRPKLARLGLSSSIADVTDPKYKSCLRLAEAYRKRRVSEYKKTHGYVSVGAMSLIASASLQLSASRYLMEMAFGNGDLDGIRKASNLANDARQNELAAWELASREGGAKAKAAANAAPWLQGPPVKLRVPSQPKEDIETDINPFAASESTSYEKAERKAEAE